MHKIFKNFFQKLELSFLYTYGRLEPKQRRISESKLKFSTFLIKRLDFSTTLIVDPLVGIYNL